MFLSTFEKPLDAKRRFVVPQEFRAVVAAQSLFCLPAVDAPCLEAGGQPLLDRYERMVDELADGDPLKTAIEHSVFPRMTALGFDSAGRITLPESLCDAYGLNDWVAVVGLRTRFQIWDRDRYAAYAQEQQAAAAQGLPQMRLAQRPAKPAVGA